MLAAHISLLQGIINIPSDVDPYPSNVVLLLHGEGANGAATAASFVDSAKAAVPSALLNATISTVRSKFGAASVALSVGWLRYASNANFNLAAGDFTIEFWYYATAQPGSIYRLVQFQTGSSSNAQYSYVIHHLSTGIIRGGMNQSTTGYSADSAAALTLNAWNHIAFVRSGGSLVMFVNGVPGTPIVGPTAPNSFPTGTLMIGADLDGSGQTTANIDELRITKGVARYTSKFTIPATAFPNPV